MKLKTLSIGTFNLFNLNEPNLPIYSQTAGWTPELYALKRRDRPQGSFEQ